MATKTYYTCRVSGEAVVRRLDEFSLPWVDITPLSVTKAFTDIMSFPSSVDDVLICGINEIYLSNDSGVNWTTPGGDWDLAPNSINFNEVWVIDGLNSFVVGSRGAVVKSIDGGLNFDYTPTLPTGSGLLDPDFDVQSVHFITPLIGVVGVTIAGSGATVFKTIDGGVTWSWLIGGGFVAAPGYTLSCGGIHISVDQTTINVITDKGVYRSTNSGVTFDLVLDLDQTLPLPAPGVHLTWINDNELWATCFFDSIFRSIDGGANWSSVRAIDTERLPILAAHFYDTSNGFVGQNIGVGQLGIFTTADSGATLINSESIGIVHAVWTESNNPPPLCYVLRSCDSDVYPDITDVIPNAGVNLMAVTGQVINTLDVFDTPRCYTVELQEDPCGDINLIVFDYTLVGSDCASFSLETCPVEVPVTLVGDSVIIDVQINNLSADTHTFEGSFGSCIASGMIILNPSLPIAAGESGTMQIEYTPTGAEDGQCELVITGPCGEISCELCYRSVAVPVCSHFNICVTGPACAPDCIRPGEVIQFNLGGTISPVAYPTIITFSVINQVTQEIVFAADYPIADDIELDAILVNVPGLPPGSYCAEVCLPGCNAKRVLCFDVCEPFDIYKDSCNHWHVHRPGICQIEEYLVTVRPMECGAPEDAVVLDVLWDVSQDNTFEFEVPGDGIYIFEMKDPATGEVQYSFAAFETCKLQECFKIMMDKIMCSCSDPCCKRCDGSPEKEREFSRMSLNKLVPLYMTYLGMARRNELYTVGMKLVADDHLCFLHDACAILAKINDIIMDCGCLCPEQENTATNRGDCLSC